jgi:hypothetical protein
VPLTDKIITEVPLSNPKAKPKLAYCPYQIKKIREPRRRPRIEPMAAPAIATTKAICERFSFLLFARSARTIAAAPQTTENNIRATAPRVIATIEKIEPVLWFEFVDI